MHRIVLFAGLVALAPVLAGCENFDMDSLDVFHLNDKKKLPGERKEVFPEGVPGVTQGIPPEYLKGNQQADTALAPDGAAAVAAPGEKSGTAAPSAKTAAIEPAEPKLRPKTKPKPKPRTAKQQPKQGTAPPAAQAQSSDQQQLAPWPGSTQPPPAAQAAPWPSAPPPGTFSR
jgi:hypothetical protein